MIRLILCSIFIVYVLSSCETLKQSPKFSFNEGYYYSKLYHKKEKHIYVVPSEDSIKIFSAKKLGKGIDTTGAIKIILPANEKPSSFDYYSFQKSSFDFDVLNILFKLRPSVKDFPPQFNNNILNGAFYIGDRIDVYKIKYKRTPLENYQRFTSHHGYSAGLFAGIGASRIDEYVTQNAINIEYDGVVGIWGVCALMAVDKINFGLNVGEDHLFDHNRKLWIYQGKPWVGLSISLNLN
jgi:hypothetical protein